MLSELDKCNHAMICTCCAPRVLNRCARETEFLTRVYGQTAAGAGSIAFTQFEGVLRAARAATEGTFLSTSLYRVRGNKKVFCMITQSLFCKAQFPSKLLQVYIQSDSAGFNLKMGSTMLPFLSYPVITTDLFQ